MTAARTTKEFASLMAASTDTLSLVIKGHHSIEHQIQDVLLEVLPRANGVELRKVAFLLKVDFLIALGVVSPGTRPLFDQVNTIRNRFAHDPYSAFGEDDANRAKSVILSIDSKYPCVGKPDDILKILMHVVFDYTARRYARVITDKLRSEVFTEMQDDPAWHAQIVPGYEELPPITDEMLKEVRTQTDEEVGKRVRAKLADKYPHVRVDKV